MKVLIVEPGFAPYETEINGLKEMQQTVGGTITAVYPFEDKVAVVANDDGIALNLPFNRSLPEDYGGIFGTFFVCGLGEEDFCSLTDEQMKYYKKYFHKAEILLSVSRTGITTMKVPPAHKNGGEHKPKPPER